MKRRSFLQKIGLGTIAAPVAVKSLDDKAKDYHNLPVVQEPPVLEYTIEDEVTPSLIDHGVDNITCATCADVAPGLLSMKMQKQYRSI
jgi:hypothetical protein